MANEFNIKNGFISNSNSRVVGSFTATTISATTYYNLPTSTDVFVTGGTYSNNTFTYRNNTGGTFNVLFNTLTGLTVNGNVVVTGTTTVGGTNDGATKLYVNTTTLNTAIKGIGTSIGVLGSTTGIGYGVVGNGNGGTGVYGNTTSNASGYAGVWGSSVGDVNTNIGVYGYAGVGEGGTPTNIGGYFYADGQGLYNYSVKLQDGTEGVNKVLVSQTIDGKANWSSSLSGLTSVNATTISATTYLNLPSMSGSFLPLSGGTVTGTTYFTNGLSANTLSAITVQFDTSYTGTVGVGQIAWDTNFGTLQQGLVGGNVIQKIGETTFALVKNVEATTINKGEVVYIFGATGDKISVKRASNTGDTTSSKTLGVAAENIASNQDGLIITQGTLDGLNLGSYTAGDILWLSNVPGQFTTVKQYAPNHLVFIGVVQRANNGNGQLYVKPQNGYEIDELHNVLATGATYGDLLVYSAYNGYDLWVNSKNLNGSYTITGDTTVGGVMKATTVSATTYQNLPTDITITGATYSNNTFTYTNNTGGTFNVLFNTVTGLTVNGDLTVTGNTFVSGSSTTAGDVRGYSLVSTQSVGDEGGEVRLSTAQTNSSLSGGSITFDVYQNKLRFFESGGSNRGVYIDLTAAGAGVSTNLLSGGGGEINTASNLGAGTGLFAQKSAADLQFKSLTSTGGTVTISNNSTTVNLEVVPASNFTGGTVNGATTFTGGLNANTFSATTYQNLPTDIQVTGGTYSNGVSTFTNNTGGTFSVTGYNTGTTVGNGTANYLARWTGTTGLSNSIIRDDGTNIGVGMAPTTNSKFSIVTFSNNDYGLWVRNTSNLTGSKGIYGSSDSGFGNQTGVWGVGQGHPTTGTSIGVDGGATDGLLGIGVRGIVGPSEFGSMVTGIGGYFDGRGIGDYGYPTNSYSVQLLDGTEGVGKFLVSITSDGKANWTNQLSASTFTITSIPTNNDSNTQVLTRNPTTGAIEYTNSLAFNSFNYGLAAAISSGNYLI